MAGWREPAAGRGRRPGGAGRTGLAGFCGIEQRLWVGRALRNGRRSAPGAARSPAPGSLGVMRPEVGPGDATALTEAPDDLPEGGGDYLVAGRVGVDVRPDRRRSAHPGPLTDPGDVDRPGAHAWERGGVREARRAEGGLHVSGRNADGPEAGVEQRGEVTSRLTLQGLPALPL